jgi:hypothetical protein
MLHTHDSSSSRQPTWLHSRNCGYISCCKHPAKQLWKQVHSVSGIKVKVLHNQSPVHTLATLSLYTLPTLSYRLLLLLVPFKNLLQNCQHKGNLSISKEGKNCLFSDFYIIDTRSLQEFQCTHKEKNKTTTCFASLLTTRIFFCKSEEACHRDLIASSYKKSITKQKVSLSYEKPGPQYYSAPLNIP